jgi:hypothetical protein
MRKNNSRAVGNAYERAIRLEMIELGWENCQTSRYGSREVDDHKVDLLNTPPFNFQLKRWKSAPSYHEVLNAMPDGVNYNVIIHKRPSKGEVVVLSKSDFYEILKMLKGNQII